MAVPVSDLQQIAPSAVIELFQLELNAAQHGVNETYYFHAGVNADNAADIVWDGQAYLAFPIEATEFEYTGTGSLPRPKLRISNIYGTITGIILTLPNGLEGAKVTRIRTLARYLDGINFARNNLLLWSEDITQSVYFAYQCTKTSATTITVDATADPYFGQLVQSLGSIQNRTFSAGVKLKGTGTSIGNYITLYLYSESVNEIFTSMVGPLTSSYQLFTLTRTFVTSTDTGINFRVDPETNAGQSWSAGQAFDATEWQMNEGASLVTYQRTFNTHNPYGTPDPTAEFPREIYYIDRKASENRDLIEFELAAAFDLVGVRAPKRQCVSNVCQWKYRGSECGYAGNAFFDFNDAAVATIAQDVCGKRLRSCELRFSQQRFAGSVTTGSNIITLQQAVSFSTGDPVSGFGLPAGTTVSSVNGSVVTVSQNATATTFVTSAGTIQSNYTQIALTSAAGIIPGMAVTGNYLPANTQVTAVAGNTVTLSSTVDFTQFYSVIGSFGGTADRYVIQVAPNAAGSVGQLIANSLHMPLSRGAIITNVRYIWTTAGKGAFQIKLYTMSQAVDRRRGMAFGIYQFNGIPAATYNFVSTNGFYTFRANASIPYGSYPGVGTFFT